MIGQDVIKQINAEDEVICGIITEDRKIMEFKGIVDEVFPDTIKLRIITNDGKNATFYLDLSQILFILIAHKIVIGAN